VVTSSPGALRGTSEPVRRYKDVDIIHTSSLKSDYFFLVYSFIPGNGLPICYDRQSCQQPVDLRVSSFQPNPELILSTYVHRDHQGLLCFISI
jgi:hypothetical protein